MGRPTLAVLLPFFFIIAALVEPVASWISWAAVSSREYLPLGNLWTRPQILSPGTLFLSVDHYGWSRLISWFQSTPWPTLAVIMIAAIRMLSWSGIKALTKRDFEVSIPATGPRFGGWVETLTFTGWCALGSAAWRFWNGLMWDPPRTYWFPIHHGTGHITLLWAGALLGYVWTMVFLLRRSAERAFNLPRCIKCRYILQGLDLNNNCPECNQNQNKPVNRSRKSRIGKFLKRYCILALALMLISAPYLSTLIAKAWMYSRFYLNEMMN